MGIKTSGFDEFTILLKQAGGKAVEGVIAQMREEGKTIRDLARQMAPVDIGNLEKSIKTRTAGGGRNSLGQFSKKTVEVYIDGAMSVPEHPGKRIYDYAWIMHEHLGPYGPLKLGKGSQAKQNGQSVMVGGGFMERAADEVNRTMMTRLINVVKTFL